MVIYLLFSLKIESVIPYLQTGDLIIASDCLSKDKKKFKCFINSRGNFVKNSYNYSHISMIYRKNNKIFLIDFIPSDHHCSKKISLVNSKYTDGLRIVEFNKYVKEFKEKTIKKSHCCQKFGIRFINRKINQNELNRRLENEFNILSDKNFNNNNIANMIAISGWFAKDMPINFNYSTEIFYPNNQKDTFFCSEIIGVLLQRIGVMKRINRARMFYPADYAGSLDNKIFEKGMYSQIKIYE